MKVIHWMITVAAIASGLPAPAQAAQTDPEIIIYRFPGVLDDGGSENIGSATVFHCTNFSGTTENVRFVTRSISGNIVTNIVFGIGHLSTLTAATHPTRAYNDAGTPMSTGIVAQGTTAVAATSTNIICTAMTIDASTVAPIGVALRGIRFNPIPGSQE